MHLAVVCVRLYRNLLRARDHFEDFRDAAFWSSGRSDEFVAVLPQRVAAFLWFRHARPGIVESRCITIDDDTTHRVVSSGRLGCCGGRVVVSAARSTRQKLSIELMGVAEFQFAMNPLNLT